LRVGFVQGTVTVLENPQMMLFDDVLLGVRGLAKAPKFTVAVVITTADLMMGGDTIGRREAGM
jgi:hypothetical protein